MVNKVEDGRLDITINRLTPLINESLDKALRHETRVLGKAMRYSALLPGKRIRPILVLATCECCGGKIKDALPAAIAIELIHCFSLIHDDLPPLDNDDLRRGHPTNHKVFGEAQAILTGDALLAKALFILSNSNISPKITIHCLQELTSATCDMISGESLDVANVNCILTIKQLRQINQLKTSKLIEASVVMGAIIARADKNTLENLRNYSQHLGQLFQLTDDLLDITGSAATTGKTTQKDVSSGKITLGNRLGIKRSRAEIIKIHQQAINNLRRLPRTEVLRSLADFVRDRSS